MRKFFLNILFFSVCCFNSFSQQDSLYLDSLKRILPGLKDTARVDCLNTISENSQYWRGSFMPEDYRRTSDSMFKYASLAYEEADRIRYKFGLVTALLNLSGSYGNKPFTPDSIYNHAARASIMAKYGNEALRIAKETENNALLGKVYYSGIGEGKDYIENWKTSLYYYGKAGDLDNKFRVMVDLVTDLGFNIYSEERLLYADSCLQLAKEFVPVTPLDHQIVQTAFANMANIFSLAGDYETTLPYMLECDRYSRKYYGSGQPLSIGGLYYEMGKYDSASYYWQIWKKDYKTYWYGHRSYGDALLGKIYLKTRQLDKAVDMFYLSLNANKINGKYDTLTSWGPIQPLIYLGEAYYQKKDFQKALSYARQGLNYANRVGGVAYIMDGSEIISRIYHQLGNGDSAYKFLLQYHTLKDSIQNKQFLFRLNNYKKAAEETKKQSRINLLDKDNKIKDQQLKQQATTRNFLIAVFVAIILAGLFIFRNINLKRKNEKLKLEQKEQEWKVKQLESDNKHVALQRQAAELEMQALRAQMNPHFIFNCLSSINRIIMKNDNAAASDYLTRFSRLMRMVLINSQRKLISLEDELHMLRLYLDMERLRFKESFVYSIILTNTIDEGAVQVPSLLLQPFCENAIWHGLMQKDGPGLLTVELSMQDNTLNCTITDNGIGRERARERNSKSAEKEKSMGLKITAERLALLNREKDLQTSYEIEDLKDEMGNAAGTRVILKLDYKENPENNFDQTILIAEKKSNQR